MIFKKIRCDGIPYRQGWIEVTPGIHPGHINLEVWNVDAIHDLSEKSFDDARLPDDAFSANTEIELSMEQALALIDMLQSAIAVMQTSALPG